MHIDDIYVELLALTSEEVAARPDVPTESWQFFTDIVENFDGSQEELLTFIKAHLREWFRCMDKEPEWIQEPEWQFSDGKPMVFVGQIDFPAHPNGFFHDDASFFVFWNLADEVKTVIQVA